MKDRHNEILNESVQVRHTKISKNLLRFSVLFVIIHVLTQVALSQFDNRVIRRIDQLFNLNNEQNFPTYFSAMLLFFASAASYIVYKLKVNSNKFRFHWLVLSFIFLFLSLDESLELHEKLNFQTKKLIQNEVSGFLYWAWIVPYTVLFVGAGIFFFRFLLQLPAQTRKNFITSGSIYFIGAVIIESIEGYFLKIYDPSHLIFHVTITTQEFFEMIGISLFIGGVIKYIFLHQNQITVKGKNRVKNTSNELIPSKEAI